MQRQEKFGVFPGDAKNPRTQGVRWGRQREGWWLGHGSNMDSILRERVRGKDNYMHIVKLLLCCVLNRIGGRVGRGYYLGGSLRQQSGNRWYCLTLQWGQWS